MSTFLKVTLLVMYRFYENKLKPATTLKGFFVWSEQITLYFLCKTRPPVSNPDAFARRFQESVKKQK